MRRILTPSITAAAMRPTSPASPTRTPVRSWREACAITANTPSACAINVLVLRKSSRAAELLAAARSCGFSLLTSTRRAGSGCGASLVSTVAGRWSAGGGTLTGRFAAVGGESPTSIVARSRGPAALFSTISSDLLSIRQRVVHKFARSVAGCRPAGARDSSQLSDAQWRPRPILYSSHRSMRHDAYPTLFSDGDWRLRGGCQGSRHDGAVALCVYPAVDEVHECQG